jgi:hypothetical protein
VYHPEMSRALAEQHVRDLHRRAATSVRLDAPRSPVGQHWAVLAVRLHLRGAATTPVGSASVPASRPARTPRAATPTPQAGSAAARQPMGCIA